MLNTPIANKNLVIYLLVFLRVLEYFEGIMFLTTNRIESFDRAFKSRIHLTLHYPQLNPESCGKVLRNFLARADVDVSPELLLDGAEQIDSIMNGKLINGRQIKNAVHIANSLAVSQGVKLGLRHLELALSAIDDLGGGCGSQVDSKASGVNGEDNGCLSAADSAPPPRKRQRTRG